MRSLTTVLLPAALVWSCSAQTAHARARTVEKDGSGDFTIIQDALDAAVPRDSILVGPGRFDTFQSANLVLDGSPFAAIAWVTTDSLTLIGAGKYETIVGPEVHTVEAFGQDTSSLLVDAGATTWVSGFGFEKTRFIVTLFHQTVMEDCRVVREAPDAGYMVTVGFCESTVVRRCEILGPAGLITTQGVRGLLVEDCVFDDYTLNEIALVIGNGAQACMVRRCTFLRGAGGVQFSLGGTGWVEDCTFKDIRVAGIDMSSGHAIVRRCKIGTTRMCLRAGNGRLEVYDTLLEGGTQYTIASTADTYIRGSHILNVGAPSVLGSVSVEGWMLDVRENWWGTSDPAIVESWIIDEDGTVLWEPILTEPVPTKSQSVGGLKGRYRAVKGSEH